MSTVTDPARELADMCSRLARSSKLRGDEFLSKEWSVPSWSAEFYQIIFLITKRIDEVIELLKFIEMDEDFRNDAERHLQEFKRAFSPDGLQNNWSHSVQHFFNEANVQTAKMLSPQMRALRQYPKLEDSELEELLATVEELREWLREFQLNEQDFIRQAILDGLDNFHFRLKRIGWVGWGYTLESLREVISAYIMLQHGTPNLAAAPDAEAVLRKVGAGLHAVYGKLKIGQEFGEAIDFYLRFCGATVIATKGGQAVAGLLPPT